MDESLKVVAKIQNDSDLTDPKKSVPELPPPNEWGVQLYNEDDVREDITVRELMDMAVNDPNFDFTEPHMIAFLEVQALTVGPALTAGPALTGGPVPTIITTEASPSPSTSGERRWRRRTRKKRRSRRRKPKGKSRRRRRKKSKN